MDVESIVNLPISISAESDESIFKGAEKVITAIRPEWNPQDISFRILSDGLTNKLVRCTVKDGAVNEAVLVRIYGNKTEILIDRKAEIRNIKLLNQYKLAPALYATFNNGFAYEFVPGSTLTSKTVCQPEIFPLIARHLAKLHKVQFKNAQVDETNDVPKPILWRTLEKFLKLVPEQFTSKHINTQFLNMKLSKLQLLKEVNDMKSHIEHLGSPVVFCHNDLLLDNVIYTHLTSNNCEDLRKTQISFIDFEYAGFNYQGYDIGNHFAEFAGVGNVDYDYYPSKEMQYAWLKQYAEEYYSANGSVVNDELLDTLYVQVNHFALVSHLLWGIWSLIQAENSNVDFNFIEYASIRFNEYFRKKDSFLSLQLPVNES